ncbi:biotin transporter BioY [Cohnella fermenti]|uniref:Biotin transporter BioY n=1 Tax=Cohnella fermenti TaxID=2565925 RepID=A0A4V3WF09_9BACL|nr:biotin transporter BioY [Cohnella fermenti]THF78458.1 biotin transporter BioY [Cohnella fermenti]
MPSSSSNSNPATTPATTDPHTSNARNQKTQQPPEPIGPLRANSAAWIRGSVFTALFAALFIAFSSITLPIGISPVPITLQTLAIMLAGGFLGAFYGFWSIAIVILLTATGLPLLHGNGGLSLLLGPTGGFLWMFPFCALFIGWVTDLLFRGARSASVLRFVLLTVAIYIGDLLSYIGGVPWLAFKIDASLAKAISVGMTPYVGFDAIKAVIAAMLIVALRPVLTPLRKRSR